MQLLLHYTKLNHGEPKNKAFQVNLTFFGGVFGLQLLAAGKKVDTKNY